ncbi:hypothetical protein CNMCM5793_006746 [Aspergillus hiratsukae]|uniref:NodB homology domain-containing protein n=1 Tax=Aspergillus hiratsukae TaxID=1194566 RepID=A0A8H6PH29_9EURO|nr:hypothetical protein CNMCM5793_006746 [Aspergillus hiratsukae]KAF7173613.1 hypothetical protein CNMCM6106_007683 [Aspergillus hiratsukae]
MHSLILLPLLLTLRSISSNNTFPRDNDARVSLVPIGAVIDHCAVPGTITLTFDDGLFIYTAHMLDTLAFHGAIATFFLNGVNKGSIDGFPELHPYLHTLNYPAIIGQMTRLEEAFARIIGFYPTYMRMPFLMFNEVALSALADLGYHVIGASIDTKDYEMMTLE